MKKNWVSVLSLAGLVVIGLTTCVSQPGERATAAKGFDVQIMIGDGVLTAGQKAEIKDYKEAMQRQMKNMAQQGPGGAGGFGAGPGQQHGAPPAGGGQPASKQRLQKELDAFIAILQERQKEIEG